MSNQRKIFVAIKKEFLTQFSRELEENFDNRKQDVLWQEQ